MLRAHKVALDPTDRQATGLARAAGAARFAYNWALAWWGREHAYSTCGMTDAVKPSQYSLRREPNTIKGERFPRMLESTKCGSQEVIIALGVVAFGNFFAGWAKYPQFKKRGVRDSFKLSSGRFAVQGRSIRIANLGWVRMREAVRFVGAKSFR